MAETTEQDAVRDAMGAVLGRIPSGVFVATAANAAGDETGMLASWVQQAAFEPPMISVAVNQKRFLNDWIAAAPRLAVSVVGEKQTELLKHFAAGFDPGAQAFTGINLTRGTTGLPLLADAVGYLEGDVAGQVAAGDHLVYVVRLTGAGRGASFADRSPLVHLRKNGFAY